MKKNFILQTDSYKVTHYDQYPENVTKIYSYLESRGGMYPATVFFGLQYYLKEYLEGVRVTKEDLDEAYELMKLHFNKDLINIEGWEYIINTCKGKLPLLIKAVPEGSLVKNHNVLMTIENTDPIVPWLTNYVETILMKIWAPITVATNSFYLKVMLNEALQRTAIDKTADFMMHDFGYRGVSSDESAGILGMAHLTSFKGTDTLAALRFAKQYYNEPCAGFSVPATEHSTMTVWGKDNEREAVLNLLKMNPTGIVSCVGDSYNIYKFCEMLSSDAEIKFMILSREGKFVVRPDSGDPVEVLNRVLDILWNGFGGTYNIKHYKILDPHIGIIQGDGVNYQSIEAILDMFETKRFSAENIVFGSGGALLQKFDRDTQKFAIKASYGEMTVDDKTVGFNIQKDPVTSSSKKSKAGRLKLIPAYGGKSNVSFSTKTSDSDNFDSYADALETVFLNGEIVKSTSFADVRKRIEVAHVLSAVPEHAEV